MKYFHLFLISAFAGILMAGCTGAPATQLHFSVNGVEYTAPLTGCDTVSLVTLSTEFDATVEVANFKGFSRITVDQVPLRRGKAAVSVSRIAKDSFITLSWVRKDGSGTVKKQHPLQLKKQLLQLSQTLKVRFTMHTGMAL